MSFVLDALRDKPLFLCRMDDSSPLQDYSGYNITAPIAGGTPTQHAALMKGATYAPIFTSAITASFPSLVFKQGFESQEFTLAAWVKVINSAGTGDQQILGNSGQMDGLMVNDKTVSFVTKYTTTGEARASYNLQNEQAFSVYGVHTQSKNILYINGVQVAESDISEAQQADTYASTSSSLFCGTTSGSQKIAVNGVACYGSALSGTSIARQHAEGRAVQPYEDIVSANLGDYIPVSESVANMFLIQEWDDEEDWNSGVWNYVGVVEDDLVPQYDSTGTSVKGYWYTNFDIASPGTTSIYGVALDWDGIGITVEVSVDGTSWETVSRATKCTTVPATYDPTNKELQIRVGFPGSVLNDTAYLSSLRAVGFNSGVSKESSGRTVTFSGATPNYEEDPMTYHDNWGAKVASGGSLTISADALESTVARTIEVWIKRNGTNPTFSATGTYYQNGAASSNTLVDDQWTLFHIVASADITGSITINGPAQVGYVGIYDTALSAGAIAAIYAAQTGTHQQTPSSVSTLGVTEPATSAQIYAYDWSITGAG